ncbi:type IV secretion protein IcmX [Legionella impletisoli]|uniref:Intracellular multiplication protein IcmX n=1 Tax=Legionella impletisoli TaxID=343510 RepID=A0A917JSZ0_9GAMM|nr:type IV secretion protein IcmX [Legionella impletisoli]GGI83071.1 intracellular multiplication protein IcmX [Legionella impletisoli]
MKHFKTKGFVAGLLLSLGLPVSAQYNVQDDPDNPFADSMQKLVQYVQHLGLYLGYDLTSQQAPAPYSQLVNAPLAQVLQSYAFNTLLGSIPVNAISAAYSSFTPPTTQGYSQLNVFANLVFSQPVNGADKSIFINPSLDQQPNQQDPVSQNVLNILTTPDISYCTSKSPPPLCKGLVSKNVIGKPPSLAYYNYDQLKDVLPQLNGNTLLAPLLYSTQSAQQGGTSSEAAIPQQDQGLTAQNQAQAAANFIRFAIGIVPIELPSQSDYQKLYETATASGIKMPSAEDQLVAQAALNNYLVSLQSYASQLSIPLSNLYFALGKRLPQNQGDTNNPRMTSQALSEFSMATWRLYNPSQGTGDTQWLNKINTASPATVQKEIAILLAEINYQMYLNRQQDERMLLTNSLLLLTNLKSAQPSFPTQAETGS